MDFLIKNLRVNLYVAGNVNLKQVKILDRFGQNAVASFLMQPPDSMT